ncbi:Uu.00g098740.m01.CDS01 [Anthostomella pinea]|uniref:Uu.00g098740.m01.CDS01 n=1 Tax=Anthostomella pinea TaxID=933095 RepID=A0AAI8VDN2_9PEZI|nr:Uu.00g098740.m01.CDS01 [Anthostomella pinea]
MSSIIGLDAVTAALFTPTTLLRLITLWLVYRLSLALYNVSPFQPLHQFPGPKLAAASFFYEAWYDLVKGGRYSHEIKAMHEKYGPIVRINPEELHCNDYDFVDEIYPSTGRIRDKHAHFLASLFGPLEVSASATPDHETHRVRRNAINRFFSRKQILRIEPLVHDMAQKMCSKILRSTGEPINMIDPYNCFTADTISEYSYGESFGFLDRDDFGQNFKRAFEALVTTTHTVRFFPILRHTVRLMPLIGGAMGPDIAYLVKSMYETIPSHIVKAQERKSSGNIFTELLESSLPASEKSMYRLSGEGWSLVAAGSETTAAALTFITYFLLSEPDVAARLTEELKNENPMKLSWVQLERYPYLFAVIHEALRISLGISSRLPRIARNEDLVYTNRGFNYVGVFPDPEKFRPERWLDGQGRADHSMEKYIMSFGKGTRQCVGMNLAFCELYLVTAVLVLRLIPHMTLYDTVFEDIKYEFDRLTPQPRAGARGVRVTIS